MERLLKIDEVSDLLHVSPKTIYNWVCYGYIPHLKIFSERAHRGAVRFKQSDLEDWLNKRRSMGRISHKEIIPH